MVEPKPHDDIGLLHAFLSERDVDCPVCAYNLRNCQSTACPECGAHLDLRIGSPDVRIGPFLAALLAAALPMGACALWAIVGFVVQIADARQSTENWIIICALLVAALIFFGETMLIIRLRKRFWKASALRQWRLTILIACTNLVVFASTIGALWKFM